jgi:PIN domain nuclease of toxin-antitoxin system
MATMLLDSQVALWVLDDNPRLGTGARQQLTSAPRVHVSAATVWELTIKTMLGKLSVPENLPEVLVQQGLELMPITAKHAAGIREFPELLRHDPFDRLIAAQANIEGMHLLTADRVLLGLGRPVVLDATV